MAEQAQTEAAVSEQQTAPDAGKPLTVNEAENSIADLLGADLDTPDPKAKTNEDKDEDAEEDPLGTTEEDVEPETADDTSDGSGTAGKYVAANAKYKLADGTEITVGELARNNLFQRDYTGKTEEVARERETITKEKAEVAQLSQTLSAEREYVIWFAQTHAPKMPEPPALSAAEDPIGHLQYNEDVRKYQVFAESYRQFTESQKADTERQKGETQAEANKRAAKEVTVLFDKVKIDPQSPKAKQFFDAIEKGASEFYGLNADQIANLAKQDHRTILVLRDAIRAKQNKKAVPEVATKLKTVPKMLRAPTARQAPDQQQARVRTQSGDKLRQTGSMSDGIAAIEALIS